MNDHEPATPGQPSCARGNERLDELLADPQLAADVAAAHADAEEMDRVPNSKPLEPSHRRRETPC